MFLNGKGYGHTASNVSGRWASWLLSLPVGLHSDSWEKGAAANVNTPHPHHKHPIGMEASVKSHRKMTAVRPPDTDWYVVAVVGRLKTPTLPHPSKHRQNHPALPLPKQTHRCRRPSVRTISHTKVAQCQAKKQTVVQRPTNLLLCSLALFWSRAKECIIPFDNHHQFLLSRIIHRPAPPTVRYAFVLSPSPPCCQPGARGHPKDSLRPNLNLWTPQNISPCRCPTLPDKPAHPRSQQPPPSRLITNKKYTKTPQQTGINNS